MSALDRVRYLLRHYRGRALLRAGYWYLLRWYGSEICQDCGRPVGQLWWCNDDALWERLVERGSGGIRCIECFDKAARALGLWIEWMPGNFRHLARAALKEETPDA